MSANTWMVLICLGVLFLGLVWAALRPLKPYAPDPYEEATGDWPHRYTPEKEYHE